MSEQNQFIEALRWRYATKAFDHGQFLPEDTLSALIESVWLAPSSVNLQPYRLIVIRDQALRENLVKHTWGQEKVAQCCALFVFAVMSHIDEGTIDAFLDRLAVERGLGRDKLSEIEFKAKKYILGMMPEARIAWARRQTYLALGNMLAAAAMMKVDACPMEGFDHPDYDTILGLPAQGLSAAVLAAVGYRSEGDPTAGIPKYRGSRSEFFEII